ncbi:NAD(P)H-hydrate dehydratase [Nakamurella sp. YIM 132087]|uniref:ADP-dependent (S)-NAD(P)H-hydrate dehydratase n=1 Tax=Nakamurella alba TaxID=2665158 RepID=A0A7K1FLE8_9ACTN|nr:NAD(P)H-hydrate dehydratase [Nakamurella alba]
MTPAMLRDWPLPDTDGGKYGRGQILVIGGARGTPGAAQLGGLSALRVGAGRLTLAVAESVAVPLAVATPEAGVVGLPEDEKGSVLPSAAERLHDAIGRADAVVIGSGLDDPELTGALLDELRPALADSTAPVLLDAFALGVLAGRTGLVADLAGRLVLTPNAEEGARLLEQSDFDPDSDLLPLARRYGAVVTAKGRVADGARLWRITSGHSGLGTSGSGDVLAGAIAGLLARGAEPAQAACWGTHLHAVAGDRLIAAIGPMGFLARELADALPQALAELDR